MALSIPCSNAYAPIARTYRTVAKAVVPTIFHTDTAFPPASPQGRND